MVSVYLQSLKGESQSEIFFVGKELEYQVFHTGIPELIKL